MTARDNRGRFQNADVAAAERVLEAAVREAREAIAGADTETVRVGAGEIARTVRLYDKPAVVAMLTAAGMSADLLLRSAS